MSRIYAPEDRWAWIEIDQAALRQNYRAIRQVVDPTAQIICVVKANAYGHGAPQCAQILKAAGANYFAVATVSEALELRMAGITDPVLILSEPPQSAVPTLVDFDLTVALATAEFGLALGEYAASCGKVARYHLALDTGMNRCGMQVSDAVEIRQMLDFHCGLLCEGTFTHFATAEQHDDWDFALQLNRFQTALAELEAAGFDTGLVHCNNTAATFIHPESGFGGCRVGLALFGLYPSPDMRTLCALTPVMSVRARISRTHYPKVGDGVSYGMTYRIPKNTTQIATIPLGYADGLSRDLSNRMDVLVEGVRYQQVGLICMDQCMFKADVNELRAYRPVQPLTVGDVVTIMGRDGSDEISADELARLRNTISYEVVCNFGARLERVYC